MGVRKYTRFISSVERDIIKFDISKHTYIVLGPVV